ncbi:PREDICTED: F-box protein At3g28330-like [Brassica oleracea var. oleracea]|uniref:F-box protein At3g28330-like n=1 Tax=Brassica oleracea var. oleracea TaxID=109376 RepID=UPI0006A6E07B|nr:PREDICTED: F-box protein At3g28330-like [Brassica oleracea var. oleracea]
MADLLSILSLTISPSFHSISLNNSLIHIACFAASVAAMNSASHDDNATVCCFCDVQVISDEPLELSNTLLESPFLRRLFLSRHQLSHSMWSLMVKDDQQEAVAHYRCDIWGHPTQQLGSYIATSITEAFLNHKQKYRQVGAVAYTDVGLILIQEDYWNLGLATLTDRDGVVLGYKVVLLYDAIPRKKSFSLLIYSSETGLWSQETVQFPYSFSRQEFRYSISLNGNLHWVARNNVNDEVVVSTDFYGSEHPLWVVGALHVSRGSLMYMNIAAQGDEHDKLSVWRLKSSWEWQIVSEVSYIGYKHPYIPLAINPFDAETVYFWSNDLDNQCLVSMNLRIGEFVFHGKLERSSSDGCIVKSPEGHTFIQLAQEFS